MPVIEANLRPVQIMQTMADQHIARAIYELECHQNLWWAERESEDDFLSELKEIIKKLKECNLRIDKR